MEEFFDEYEKYLSQQSNLSANTLESYTRDIRQFIDFLKVEAEPADSQPPDKLAEYYLIQLKNKGVSTSTMLRKLSSMRNYLRFLKNKGYADNDPTLSFSAPKNEKKPANALTMQEIQMLLEQPVGDDYKSVRDKAMLELLYATGLRVSELMALNIDDVDIDSGHIVCSGRIKGKTIPINSRSLMFLLHYITNVRCLVVKSDEKALFVNLQGIRMTRQGFWKIIKYYNRKSGIDKQITPNMLRHSFAIHMLGSGADIKVVQQRLGHAAVSSTQRYGL